MFLAKHPFFKLVLLLCLTTNVFGHDEPSQKKSLIRFTENKNQWDSFIKFRAQLDGGALFLQNNRLTYHFYDKETYRSLHANPKAKLKPIKTSWFHVNFINANSNVQFQSLKPSADYNNYFIGNNKSKWSSNVKNYKEIWYKNLWNGINLQMLGNDNSIKYNFYVAAGSNTSDIKLHYEGVKSIKLKNNILTITNGVNEIVEHEPYAFQIINGVKVEVKCDFELNKNILSYNFPNGYNTNYELVIDPVLVFACSSGSTADNFGMTATYDDEGNLYSGGTVFDVGFPTTVGAIDETYNGIVQYGRTDIVLTKYDSSGTFLRYSTYLGGVVNTEVVNSLIVDAQNNLYAYGVTSSSDFPVTSGAYDESFNGGPSITFVNNGAFFDNGADIFIAKLNPTGTSLLGSTFIGGANNDGLNYTNTLSGGGDPMYDSLMTNYGDQNRGEIQLDLSNNVYIASTTRSSDFPIVNGFDNSLNGIQDAVVFKLNTNLTQLVWSTYFGGNSMESGNALVLDSEENIYFTGGTCSQSLISTTGVIQPNYGGGKSDGYIAKLKTGGTELLHATYLGVNFYDNCFFVQQDVDGEIYVLGQSQGNFSVINAVYSNTNGKIFISKLDSALSTVLMQTRIGNGLNQIVLSPSAFLVDCAKNIYFSGWGGNILNGAPTTNMPITANAYQSTTDGFNFYLMTLSPNAGSLLYATYFGGGQSREHVDGGTSRFDKKGIIYQSVCAGCWGNQDFPVTQGSWPTSVFGNNWNQSTTGCNNGTFKFNFEYAIPQANISASAFSGCSPLTVNFTNGNISATQYFWDFGNNDTTSSILNPIRTFTTPGIYTVHLLAKNNNCFNVWDTASVTITVLETPDAQASTTIQSCSSTFNFTNTSTPLLNISHNWSFGDGFTSTIQNPSHTYNSVGSYTANLTVTHTNGCKDSVQVPVQNIVLPDTVTGGGGYCINAPEQIQLNASGGTVYSWLPVSGLSSPNISNPTANPTVSTIYTVTISETDFGGNNCVSTKTVSITVYPKPDVNFNPIIQPCSNTFDFINTTSGVTSANYVWQLGDGSTSITTNANHTYSANGTYTVSLLAISDNGCKDSIQKTINLNLSPDSIGSGGAYCFDSIFPIQLSASGGSSYLWSPATGLSNTLIANPIANPTTTTTYTVTIRELDFGGNICESNPTVTITVYPAIVADFSSAVNACVNTLHFQDLSVANASNWYWDFGDGITSNIQNPIHSYALTGTYPVTLAVANQYGCNDTISKPLTLGSFPPLGVSANQVMCYGNTVQLNASGGIAYDWSPAITLSNNAISNPLASPTTTTIYTVTVTSLSTTGDTCYSDLYTKVTVPVLSNTQLTTTANPDTIYVGDYSNINSNIASPYSIFWSPNYQLSSNTAFDPVATPQHTTTYAAIAQDVNGCKYLLDSVTIVVLSKVCDEGTVYIPNTFTPNNDGNNDVLYVRSNHTTEIYFAIYNRWGEMVFETTDITKGWDGMYKGMKADPGVFGYYVRFTCNNEEKSFKKGNITLIR